MTRPVQPGHRPSTSFWASLIIVLLILNTTLASVYLQRTSALPTEGVTATATPTAPQERQPTVTVESPLPTPQATRTRRPSMIPTPTSPSPLATPTPESSQCTETTGQVRKETYSSRVRGSDQEYLIYVPPCYNTASTRYPTIYLFHGHPYDETHWESLGVFRAMDEGIRSGKLAPAIIVLPSADSDPYINASGGPGSFEPQVVEELVPTIDRLFRTDPRPEMRAIGGISRGGVWSLEIGFRHPDLFSIVGGHSACLNLNLAPPTLDPLKLTDKPTLKTQRIWLDAGNRDYCQPGVNALHTALERSGVAHQYQLWPGLHEDALWAEHLTDYLTFYTQTWPKP